MATLRDPLFGLNNAPNAEWQAAEIEAQRPNSLRGGWESGRIGTEVNALNADISSLRASGDTARADGLQREADALRQQQARVMPRIGRLEDINGAGDALSWAAGQMGQGAASMVEPVAAATAIGGVGALMGMAPGGIGAAGRALRNFGAPAAAYGLNQRQLKGEFYGEASRDAELMARTSPQDLNNTAEMYGAGAALLDTAPHALLGRMFTGGLRKGLGGMGVGAATVLGMGGEGLTEAAQNYGSQQTRGYLNPNRDTTDDFMENVNAGAGGFVGSGPMSAGGAMANAGYHRVGVTADQIGAKTGEMVDLAREKYEGSALQGGVDKALSAGKQKAGDLMDLARDDEGNISLTRLAEAAGAARDSVQDGAQDLVQRYKVSAEERAILEAAPPQGLEQDPEKYAAWFAETSGKRTNFVAQRLDEMAENDPAAADLFDRLVGETDPAAQQAVAEEGASYILQNNEIEQLQTRAERAAAAAGEFAMKGAGAVGKGAVTAGKAAAKFGKAMYDGAAGEMRKQNKQGGITTTPYDEWVQRRDQMRAGALPIEEQGERRAAANRVLDAEAIRRDPKKAEAMERSRRRAELFGEILEAEARSARAVFATRADPAVEDAFGLITRHAGYELADIADSWGLREGAAKPGLNAGTRQSRVLTMALDRITNSMRIALRDRAAPVIDELQAQAEPQAAPLFDYVRERLTASATPAGRKAIAATRNNIANEMMMLVPDARRAEIMNSEAEKGGKLSRAWLLESVEALANGHESPKFRAALDEAFGKDVVSQMIGMVSDVLPAPPKLMYGVTYGGEESLIAATVNEDGEYEGETTAEGMTGFEQRQAEKNVAKGSGSKVYGFYRGGLSSLRGSTDRRDPFAPLTKTSKGATPDRPALFGLADGLSDALAASTPGGLLIDDGMGGQRRMTAIEKKIADMEKSLEAAGGYVVGKQSAHDVMKDLGFQPGKILSVYRDYLAQDASKKGMDPAEKSALLDRAARVAGAVLDAVEQGGERKVFRIPAGERKQLLNDAKEYFKERYVAVAERPSNRDPSRIETTEMLNMARAGAKSVEFARKDEATQGATLDDANLITFQSDLMGTKNRGLHIPAKRLVGWVRAQRAQSQEQGKAKAKAKGDEYSNANKNQAFLDDLLEGITAVMTSGLVDEKLPTRINAQGNFESFAKGIPPSLRLVTSTYGDTQWGKKERLEGITRRDPIAGPPNKNDPSRDATRDDEHQERVGLDQARNEEFFVADDMEGVEPPAAYSSVTEPKTFVSRTADNARRKTMYADRPTFASGPRQRKGPTLDDAGNVVRPAPYGGETSRALGTADPKAGADREYQPPARTFPNKAAADAAAALEAAREAELEIELEMYDDSPKSLRSGNKATPLDFYPEQESGAVPDEFADQQFRTTNKATDLAVGPEPKMSAMKEAPERAAAIVKTLRKDFAAGVAMLESRLRTAQRPEFIKRPKGQKPGAPDMRGAEGGVHYIFPVAHALGLDTIASLDLGPAEARQLQALRAETAAVILAAPKLSDARKIALTRAMAPAASAGKVTVANYARLLEKAAGVGKAEVTATPTATPAAPATAGDAPTGLLQKALDARLEYLTNPPADYTTAKARAIADWAQRQLARLDAAMAGVDETGERYEALSGARLSARLLAKKAASVLEGDESLANVEGPASRVALELPGARATVAEGDYAALDAALAAISKGSGEGMSNADLDAATRWAATQAKAIKKQMAGMGEGDHRDALETIYDDLVGSLGQLGIPRSEVAKRISAAPEVAAAGVPKSQPKPSGGRDLGTLPMHYKMPPHGVRQDLRAQYPNGTTTAQLMADGHRTATTRRAFGAVGDTFTVAGREYRITALERVDMDSAAGRDKWAQREGWDLAYTQKNLSGQVFTGAVQTVFEPAGAPKSRPKPSGAVNVWHSTGENARLSNLAARPFTLGGKQFHSVEHAYQSWKSGEFDQGTYARYTGAERKIAGAKGTKTEGGWNLRMMRRLVEESFRQNPDAAQALLATGDAPITHTQDRGVWAKEFPRILSEVRAELAENVGKSAPAEFTNHSGGALGADSMFDKVGRSLGFTKHNHYYHGNKTPTGNVALTQSQVDEGIVHAKRAAAVLARPWNDKYASLLGRNWFQVKNASQVIAVAPLIEPGELNEKGYASKAKRTTVGGGTGYAVEMAIANGKEVRVFDTKSNRWFAWDGQGFVESGVPALAKDYAGIGSRQDYGRMTPESIQAIRDVFEKALAPKTGLWADTGARKLNAQVGTTMAASREIMRGLGFKAAPPQFADVAAKLLTDPNVDPAKFVHESAEGLSHLLMEGKSGEQIRTALRREVWFPQRAKIAARLVQGGMKRGDALVESYREITRAALAQELVARSQAEKSFVGMIKQLAKDFMSRFKEVTDRAEFADLVRNNLNDLIAKAKGPIDLKANFTKVSFQGAVDGDPVAARVLAHMSTDPNIAITGSIVLAHNGPIYRNAANMLHDLGFVVKSTKEAAEAHLRKAFPGAVQVYDFTASKVKVDSFLVPPADATIENIVREYGEKGKVMSFDVVKDGKVIGRTWNDKDGEHKSGISGTFVDLFTGSKQEVVTAIPFTVDGKPHSVGAVSFGSIFDEKLSMGRSKDLTDYLWFEPTSGRKLNRQASAPRKGYGVTEDFEGSPVARPGRIGPVPNAVLASEIDESGDIVMHMFAEGQTLEDGDVLTFDLFRNDEGSWEIGVDGPQPGTGHAREFADLFDKVTAPDGTEYAKFRDGVFSKAETRMLLRTLREHAAVLGVRPDEIVVSRDTGSFAGKGVRTMPSALFQKANRQDGNARIASQAEMDEAKAYVKKVLGPQIKVTFKELTGYSGEWLDAEQAIEISTTSAAGALGTAYHEALHGFFSKFVKSDPRVLETLKSLAENDKILGRLAALLAKHPAALEQLKSGEERLAYIYQFWAAGKLDLPMGKPRTVLQKVRKFFRRVLGLVRDSERAVALFEAFHGGQLAQPSAAGRVIAGILDEGTGVLKARRKVDGVAQWLAAKTMPAETILATSESKAAQALAKEFFTNPGDGTVGQEAEGYLNARRRMAARYNNTFAQATQGLSDRDMTDVARYLQQEAELSDIGYAPHREAVGKIRNLLQRFYRYMSDERGLELGHAGDKYYPRVWNTALLHQKKDQFVAMLTEHYGDVLAQGAQGSKGRLSEEQVAERIWRALIDREGVNDKFDAQRQDGVLAPFFASKENRTLEWLQGEHAEPFLEKSLVGTLSRYFHQGVRAAEYTDRFGADGEHLEKRLMEVQNELVEISHTRAKRKEFKDDEARAKWAKRQYRDVAEAVGAMEGTLGKDISPGMRKLNSWTTVYQNVRLLPLSLFSSFVDPLGMVARGATMKEAYDGFLRGMKEVVRTWGDMFREEPKERQADQWERLAEHVGAVDAAMFSHHVSDEYSSVYMVRGAKKINDAMFKLNGMEAWNRGMRVAGTKSAVKFIERHSALPDKAHSARWLQELGLDPKNIPLDGEGNLITDKSVLISEKGMGKAQAEREIDAIHYAINRWVEGAILTPNAAQRPAWGSDPHYSMFFHLKQFSYSFHQTLIKRAVQEMNHGNLAPLGAFVWYIPAMIAADITKGLIQGGGELPTYMKAYDAGDWVMHGVQRAGVLGVGTMGVDAQADVFSLAGPAVEQMVDAMVDPLERTLLKAAPAHGLYAEAFR